MRRLPFAVLSGLGLLLARTSWAGPPALPADSAEPAPAPVAETPAAETPDAPVDASAEGSASADLDVTGLDGSGGVAEAAEVEDEEAPTRRRDRRRDRDAGDEDDGETDSDVGDDNDPGMVQGRREHMMQTNRGSIGLFHTSLPDAGGRNTFRFRLHTDFFRKEEFIFGGPPGPDEHARVRGGVDISFSPLEYLELFFSVNNSANRNARPQADRQDADAVFALGDLDFGLKGAYRMKNGIGFGGQAGLGLLSGSDRLLTEGVNFYVDGLFAVDIRYLTKKQFPFRYTTNVGWILDNSLQIADFGGIADSTSREVLRFSLGANHNRMRLRNAIDFPVRFGKEKQFGINPFVEWSWDISTQEELPAFGQPGAEPSPMPRSSQWITLGTRANVVSGLHIDAGVDIGVVSPSYEFGPPTPPWQVILGLGWSFDPNPIVKEVEVEAAAPPPPPPAVVLDGRIVGQVVDAAGTPIPGAIVTFPGLTTTSIIADANGSFTSFRFAAGSIPVQVVGADAAVLAEGSAEVTAGEDTSMTIQVEQAAAPATGIMQAAITDSSGAGVAGSMRVVGNGVDQSFESTPEAVGLIALELNEGDYRATVTAPGYKPAETSFTVQPGAEVNVSVTLEPDAPVETPHVKASRRAIRLTKRLRYTGANGIAEASKPVLDELAAYLKQHPEYELIEVRTHTDDKGAAKKRTDERAEAVKNHLVGAGVASTRLSTRGLGSSKPVAVNMTAAGRAKNNRTEFSVKKYGG